MNSLRLSTMLLLALLISACSDAPTDSETTQESPASYTCPMHPHYLSNDPDGTCPICGMDLVPAATQEPDKTTDEVSSNMTIPVSESMLQTMGVRTALAEISDLGRSLRAFGTVEADERLENVSVSRLEGWIESLNVRAEGDAVAKGDLLYRVYSPDLISAQQDYLGAMANGNKTRIASVKQRLLSIGMQLEPLQQLTQDRAIIQKVPVYAETDGVVAELAVRNGDYVKPGTPILRLQSYRKVWVIASIPESDLPFINQGIKANLRFPSAPHAAPVAEIDYIYPTIDPKTRTARVRLELDNPQGDLQPGAYADITLSFDKQPRLSIVSEAILRDSRGSHVILAYGDGRFGTRSVSTGISADGRTEILSGLQPGERVVASGQFMLDSEVNLREGLSKLAPPAMPIEVVDPHRTHASNHNATTLADINIVAADVAKIDHLVDMALYFHSTLKTQAAIDPRLVAPAVTLADELSSKYRATALGTLLNASKLALIEAQASTDSLELAAELSRLMHALSPWLLEGMPQHYADLGVALYRDVQTDQLWLQKRPADEQQVDNPYTTGDVEQIAWPSLHGEVNSNKRAESVSDPHAEHRMSELQEVVR